MQLLRTQSASKDQVEDFLLKNIEIDREDLISKGYIVRMDNRIIGCFILDQLKDRLYWLRQLYIMKEETMKLPLVIEAILVLAKDKEATQVFVNSHQVMLDIILNALTFYPAPYPLSDQKDIESKGKWWAYDLNH